MGRTFPHSEITHNVSLLAAAILGPGSPSKRYVWENAAKDPGRLPACKRAFAT